MPTIFLPEKKKKDYNTLKDNYNFRYVDNTGRWRELRFHYLRNNPLCNRCLEKGIVNSAIDCHHIQPLSSEKDISKKIEIGFDVNNLEGLCKECHIEHHKNKKKK